ncbi:protein of unknown function DUF814 [Macrophomina phaseolina MS6]|uniref:NFACT RNA-binding domain-containing protein n=1 Tax=Macrophomina phaseolina (strain MS6) TaxID=1126212 RepID=K2QT90_MACPH|nr:protein of unknown function DUF814 [Macrophomina phaseolina MS6]
MLCSLSSPLFHFARRVRSDGFRFHVDNLSSAHIYVRLRDGETWDNIPEELLKDCAQLTKANSIEGNKKNNITVIYTPWSNLKKDGSMAVGQVGFKDNKKVKRIHVVERENPIINRLNKTKVEKYPDLRQEREDRRSELRKKDRAAQQERASQSPLEDLVAQSSNQDRDEDFLDDFM